MIRRILFFVLAFLAISVVSSLAAKKSFAILTGSSMQAVFDNYGTTDITVSYAYRDANSWFHNDTNTPDTKVVPAGTSNVLGFYFEKSGAFVEPVQVWWSIPCFDPFTEADGTKYPGDPIVSYVVHVDVTCPSAPTGLAGSCDASYNLSFSWTNTVHTQYDVNVNDTIDGEGGPTDTFHLKTAANTYSRSGQAGRTYTWWVHTLYNSRWSAATNGNTITCGAAPTPPPEPTRNTPSQSCSGSNVNVTFSWNAVSGATAYRLDIWDPGGVWTGNSHEGGGTTGWAYQDTGGSTSWTWTFSSNSGQTWTARALANGLWSDIATWSGVTTINCSLPTPEPLSITANAGCPLSVLQVRFDWTQENNETGYTLEVSTSPTSFTTKGSVNTGLNINYFTWSSSSPLSGTPSTPAYSTTYYARVKAFNGNGSTGYSNTVTVPGVAGTSCSPPKVQMRVFIDTDGGIDYDTGGTEDFGSGTNPAFSSSIATVTQVVNSVSTDITSSISSGGTRTGDVTAGVLTYYKVTVASGWTLMSVSGSNKYLSSILNLASPTCTANPCAYSTASPPATGQWVGTTNGVWDLKIGLKPATATMNVRIFYDKNANGIFDAGETFNTGGNVGFSSAVANVDEYKGVFSYTVTIPRTGDLTPNGTYTSTVDATIPRGFGLVPSSGWVLTKFSSDRATNYYGINSCAANVGCSYMSNGSSNQYTPSGGETFNFWLGINTLTPANPGIVTGIGSSSSDCNSTNVWITFFWNDYATFETGYQLDVSTVSSFSTLVGTKTLGANVNTFTWKNSAVASENLDNGAKPLYAPTSYYWRVRALNYSSASANVVSSNTAGGPLQSSCTAPADPTNLVASSSCSSGILTVNFSFTDNATNESGYIIDVSTGGNATTWATTWGGKYLNANTSSFAWKNTALDSDLLSFPDADPSTAGNQIAPSFGTTYRWRVVAYNIRNIESNHKYPLNTTSPTGTAFVTPTSASCAPPANPTNPTVAITCPGGLPSLAFSWTDNANNDTDYYVDINGAAWTGDSAPSPWGTKTLTGNGATTGAMSWTWSSTSAVDTGGDTDPVTAGNQLTPQINHTYYWRLIARNNNTAPALYSAHIYPNAGTGTTTWPGTPVTPNCSPNLVISAVPAFTIPNGDAGSSQNATLTIQNAGASATATGFEVAIRINGSTMSCGANQDFVSAQAALAAGASRAVTIPVTLPSAIGTLTATAMVDSDCAVNETPPASNEDDNYRTTTYSAQGFDLKASFVLNSMNVVRNGQNVVTQALKGGETATVSLTVSNNTSANKVSPAVGVGVWPNQVNTSNLPNPPTPAVPPTGVTFSSGTFTDGRSGNIGALNVGASQTVTVTFTASDVPGSYKVYAFAIPSLNPVDGNWADNSSDYDPNISIPYSVSVDTWFEGIGGDVGSQGNISVTRTPIPAGRLQSNYLAAGTGLTNVQSPWQITNYPSGMRQVPTIIYPYLEETFKNMASQNGTVSKCSVNQLVLGGIWCNGDLNISSGTGFPTPASGTPYYWFIEGNLTISGNISFNNNLAMVFIVKGDITVATNVTSIDGIYVSGSTFHAQTSAEDFVGPQLTVNGAVYTSTSDLRRILCNKPATCGSPYDNATDPAIIFKLDPKYLIILSGTKGLATPAVSWKEIAP